MTPRSFRFTLLALLLLWQSPLRAAEPPKPPASPTTQRVVKFIGTSIGFDQGAYANPPGRGPGRNTTNNPPNTGHLIVTAPEGGPPSKLLVTDELRRKFPTLYPERGELITITFKPGSLGSEIVTAAVPFDGPKTLKNPKAYLYDGLGQQKIGIQTFTTAKLSKFGQSREVLVPNRASFDGAKPQPDPAILQRLNGFAAGDVVEIEVAPGPAKATFMLLDIDAPHDPIIGEFVKLTSLKDSAGKTIPGIAIDQDGKENSYAFPAQTPGSPPNGAAAMVALAKTLKVGHSVRFNIHQVEGKLPTLRDLKLDGSMEAVGEKTYQLISTYARVEFSENNFNRDINVYYHPGSNRPDDQILDRGVSRAIESDAEIARLKLSPEQVKQLGALQDGGNDRRNARPTPQEKTQWGNAYMAWLKAQDDASRNAIELEMFRVAQDLSARWRNDFQSKHGLMRSILTADQLEEIKKMGEPKYRLAPAA